MPTGGSSGWVSARDGLSVMRAVRQPLKPRWSRRAAAMYGPVTAGIAALGAGRLTARDGLSVVRAVRPASRSISPRCGMAMYGPATAGIAALGGELAYHVYANTGAGDPINYAFPIGTTSHIIWTTSLLAAPGTWSFGIRAFDANGEEQNLDCAISIVLDSLGYDITNRPSPPVGLRGFATRSGGIRVEWLYPPAASPACPAGFHVYCTAGTSVSYTNPAATVPYSTAISKTFVANLASLSGDTAYSIGVRAFNSSGEETNTATISVVADAVGPAPVDSLTAAAIV